MQVCASLEIPTPGWGPRHPPGAPPRDGGWGRGIKHSKPRGTGDFSVKTPGFSGDFYYKNGLFFIKYDHKQTFYLLKKLWILKF